MRKEIYILLVFLVSQMNLISQDFSQLTRKDLLKVSGGLNVSSVFYDAIGIDDRRQNFTYYVSGSITGNIIGISLPFTFNYNNNKIRYSQPGNIQSFNPSYKWVKAYIGITSLNFSQYTQSGHLFSGAGVDLTPGKFKFSILYGIFKQAKEYDYETNSITNMSYKRLGYGSVFGYEHNGQAIKIIYFSAKDDVNSLPFSAGSFGLTPMENSVVSIYGKTTILKRIIVDAEWALSGLTKNTAGDLVMQNKTENQLPVIFNAKQGSEFFRALKASIGYKLKRASIACNYERVDPDYKTLGTYFVTNDIEILSLSSSLNLLQGKLSISANAGIQKNNLSKQKLNTNTRLVASTNLSYAPTKRFSIASSFSNFSNITKQKIQADPFQQQTLDTLNFYLVSKSASGTASYAYEIFGLKHSLSINSMYQLTSQFQNPSTGTKVLMPDQTKRSECNSIAGIFTYMIQHTKSKTLVSLSLNSNINTVSDFQSVYYGPTLSFGKPFVKGKIKLTTGVTYNKAFVNSSKNSEILNSRLSASFSPELPEKKAGKLNFNVSANYLSKFKSSANVKNFNELTSNVSMNYNF